MAELVDLKSQLLRLIIMTDREIILYFEVMTNLSACINYISYTSEINHIPISKSHTHSLSKYAEIKMHRYDTVTSFLPCVK